MSVKDFAVCDCKCHTKEITRVPPFSGGFSDIVLKHIMPCCGICQFCKQRIRTGARIWHEKECNDNSNL
jgi:hypothetical protein